MPQPSTSIKLAHSVDDLTAADLGPRARRTESIKLRVTAQQKARMQQVADRLDMTLSELVVQVVEHALPKLTKGAR